MAHIQPKSQRESEQKKQFKNVEQSDVAKEKQSRRDQAKEDTPQTPTATDEGGSWQFMLVIGVIGAGVLLLILKALGLF